jgi:hypothetical protein
VRGFCHHESGIQLAYCFVKFKRQNDLSVMRLAKTFAHRYKSYEKLPLPVSYSCPKLHLRSFHGINASCSQWRFKLCKKLHIMRTIPPVRACSISQKSKHHRAPLGISDPAARAELSATLTRVRRRTNSHAPACASGTTKPECVLTTRFSLLFRGCFQYSSPRFGFLSRLNETSQSVGNSNAEPLFSIESASENQVRVTSFRMKSACFFRVTYPRTFQSFRKDLSV